MNDEARLRAECAHLRLEPDPELDALRRALLVEDVLGVSLSDAQIVSMSLPDADAGAHLTPAVLPRH